uniref:Uncharacterized protein n=1 Tax=Steinernema glaseri TaxID=37863 RepID=A0A1I7Z4Y1_9BILA
MPSRPWLPPGVSPDIAISMFPYLVHPDPSDETSLDAFSLEVQLSSPPSTPTSVVAPAYPKTHRSRKSEYYRKLRSGRKQRKVERRISLASSKTLEETLSALTRFTGSARELPAFLSSQSHGDLSALGTSRYRLRRRRFRSTVFLMTRGLWTGPPDPFHMFSKFPACAPLLQAL